MCNSLRFFFARRMCIIICPSVQLAHSTFFILNELKITKVMTRFYVMCMYLGNFVILNGGIFFLFSAWNNSIHFHSIKSIPSLAYTHKFRLRMLPFEYFISLNGGFVVISMSLSLSLCSSIHVSLKENGEYDASL